MSGQETKQLSEFEREEREIRLGKQAALERAGAIVHPDRYDISQAISQLPLAVNKLPAKEAVTDKDVVYSLAGRIMFWRPHGKLIFAQVQDRSGKIQLAFMADRLPAESFALLDKLDLGDLIGVHGPLFKTKKDEPTLLVTNWQLLGKALRPLPEKWHGLQDQEERFRKRYLDLLTNPQTRGRFRTRTKIIAALREFLEQQGFEEVETPILIPEASGANAKPFVTHHDALDVDFYLRIAPETYLKRLIAGGYEKVYEFARCFRNEGLDPSHLQEFTMLEGYAAYWNYQDSMKLMRQMLRFVVKKTIGSLRFTHNQQVLDLEGEWTMVTMSDLLKTYAGVDLTKNPSDRDILKRAKELKLETPELEKLSRGNLLDLIYKKAARPKLIQPIFVVNHPIESKPLARRNEANPALADSFQLLINGWEMINAYSELVDPIDQRVRLTEQAKHRAAGDLEAMPLDEDYLTAMEYGLPPISGWGLGVDRLVALLTDQDNLKETVLFPLLRKE